MLGLSTSRLILPLHFSTLFGGSYCSASSGFTLCPLRNLRRDNHNSPQAHTRSHPSAFLTTKNAPPHLFPFPLGKSRPEATVKDELWWEGGNAPHVGHFNKPKLPEPTGVDPETLMERFKESQALEKQQKT